MSYNINRENMTSYVDVPIKVGKVSGQAFLDSGCTFNAISSEFATKCGVDVVDMEDTFKCTVGGGKIIDIARRVAQVKFDLLQLGTFETDVFVLDPIPMGKDALFGMDFLIPVNPRIDWRNGTLAVSCDTGEGAETERSARVREEMKFLTTQQFYYAKQESVKSERGWTKLISRDDYLRELERKDSMCFTIYPQAKKERIESQGWEALQGSPVYETLRKYKDSVFADSLVYEAHDQSTIQHEIELEDSTPFAIKQFRLSPEQQLAVAKWTDEMITAGLIRESTSPFNSPIFCVKKPVGWRIVHDYRVLNSRTRIPKGPIPRKDEILDAMHGAHWFSCLDLLSGYYQLSLRESDCLFTAFSTPKGHFEYLVTAQGLAGAPSTFNRFVRHIFKELDDVARVYFDDMYVFTREKEIEVHVAALDRVLRRCEEKSLKIKLSKCVFAADEIPVLGDFVGRQGVRMDPEKAIVIRDWPVPKTRRELESFLGTVVYCQRFCREYGRLVASLQSIMQGKRKNAAIEFGTVQLEAFEALKRAMSNTPVLALPDPELPFGVRMDACDFAIGGVLFQVIAGVERPIAFTGRKLSDAELRYPVREKELLAVIHALKIWRPYLIDKTFTVETDHRSLQELLTQQTCSQRLARWLDLLSEYRPEFRWISGESNTIADGLSRRPDFAPADGPASSVNLRQLLRSILESDDDTESSGRERSVFKDVDQALLVHFVMTDYDLADECRKGYSADPQFASAWEFFKRGEGNASENEAFGLFKYSKKLLWMDDRLCVPNIRELRDRVMFSEHDDPSKGHPGMFKTVQFVKTRFYWKGMEKTIKHYVKTCEKCQRNKFRQTKPPGLLQSLSVPESRWQDITMDFITDLPPSDGFNAVWVIVDRLTKRAHFIEIKMGEAESTAQECARVFCDRYQRLHGIPETVVSDRDVRFTSSFWQSWLELQGTKLCFGSAFRPNTDGQSERTNRFLEDYMRNYVHPCQHDWAKHLFLAEIAYNSRYHESLQMSPFEADLGYIPRSFSDCVLDRLRVERDAKSKEAGDLLKRQQQILSWLKQSLEKAQRRMKEYYDRNRPTLELQIGDQVLLATKNLAVEHLGIAKAATRKLGPVWIGPYRVLQQTSTDTYRIQLPNGLRLHPEFHTSLLKRYHKDDNENRLNTPNEGMIAAGGIEDAYLVEKIVSHRIHKTEKELLVKWLGYPSAQNTWESLESLRQPASDLIEEYLQHNGIDAAKWLAKPKRGKRRRLNL